MLATVELNSSDLKIWDTISGEEINTVQAHPEGGLSVDFSPNGKFLVSGGKKGFKLWEVKNNGDISLLYEYDSEFYISSVHFNFNSTIVGLAKSSKIEMFDIKNKSVSKVFGSDYNAMSDLSFSQDGQKLAAVGWSDDTNACIVNLWNTSNAEEIFTSQETGGYSSTVRFDLSGNMLISCFSGTNAIKIRDTTNFNDIITLPLWDKKCSAIDISPNGKLLVSGSFEGEIQIWDLDFDRLLYKGCQWLQTYLKSNLEIQPEDRMLCDDILNGKK